MTHIDVTNFWSSLAQIEDRMNFLVVSWELNKAIAVVLVFHWDYGINSAGLAHAVHVKPAGESFRLGKLDGSRDFHRASIQNNTLTFLVCIPLASTKNQQTILSDNSHKC